MSHHVSGRNARIRSVTSNIPKARVSVRFGSSHYGLRHEVLSSRKVAYLWSEGSGRKSIARSVRRFRNWFRSFSLQDLFEFVGRLDDLLQQTLSFLLQLLQRRDDRDYPSF